VTSGSSADVLPQPPGNLTDLRTNSVIETPVQRGVKLSLAKARVEALMRDPLRPVNLRLPELDGQQEFANKTAAAGLRVAFFAPPIRATLPRAV
jgi:hypothetical protein